MKTPNAISYITDFCFGFFSLPFLEFIGMTTAKLLKSPECVSDGTAILYIAMLTGLYYVLNRKTIVNIEYKTINILFMVLGLSILLLFIFI
jgi:hypothetical protein